MSKWKISVTLVAMLALAGCAGEDQAAGSQDITSGDCLELPAGSRFPRFGVGGGRLVLSYVMSDTVAGDRLFVREWSPDGWEADSLVASGRQWFVNWADYPSVKPLGDSLFYHYLAYAGEGTYDYDVQYAIGKAGTQVLHSDGIAAEHGFVSSAPLSDGSLQVTWLDGRHTKPAPGAAHHDHGGGGAMTLRTARVGADGEVSGRTELDGRVCDCCNTTTVTTATGTWIAYRDRSEEEVRDISFVSQGENGTWSTPKKISDDGWEITGCPVNGPALAADGSGAVAVAWYTAAGGTPRIQFARYDTSAAGFGVPILVDDQEPLGRVDLKLGEDGTAYLLGLAAAGHPDSAAVTLYTIDPDGLVAARVVDRISSSRGSGFPRLVLWQGEVWVAYTEVEENTSVRLCRVGV